MTCLCKFYFMDLSAIGLLCVKQKRNGSVKTNLSLIML